MPTIEIMKRLFRGLLSLIICHILLLSGNSVMLGQNTLKTHAKGDNRLNAQQYLEILGSAVNTLQGYYVDSIAWNKALTSAIDAMLAELDPYCEFYTEDDQQEFKTMTTGEYGGIGAVIQQRGDTVIIANPYEGKPAQLVGLRPGDAILSIDTLSMVKKTTSYVSDHLRGTAGTSFTLTFLRPYETEPRQVTITRRKINMGAVTYSGWLNDSIGYIALNQFTDKAAQEVQTALISLHGAKGLVLDLRTNPGGLLEEAVKIVGMFVPKGNVVVETKAKLPQWNSTYRTSSHPIEPDMRLAVLVDRNSASAAEILSGALQDLDRAVVMGERSFGKGLVQSTRPLPYNTLMKFTSAKYYIPSGRCIQAIDYSHQTAEIAQEDANSGYRQDQQHGGYRIPDSLTHVFHTAGGREVRDGGGIKPDIEKKAQTISNLTYYLDRENVIFDYATRYHQQHDEIAALPAFAISDEDYADFCKMAMAQKKDSILHLLKIEDMQQQLDSLQREVRQRINQNIALRYYYQHGEAQMSLVGDTLVADAVQLLADPVRYQSLLSQPVTEDKSKKRATATKKSQKKK